MKMCMRHHLLTPPTGIPPTLDDFPVPESECEKCLENEERRRKTLEQCAESFTFFITHISEIDRPAEWKYAMLNKILPNN